ncbi:TolC family protein [Candidatus Poribacteria bacterium]|nr:TolC family protein [Candidatus Poribacteria bacterium]MYG05782.1 TolC family protein [Candidatus Poribacteria bacterium]MYK21483.1 TolC family protein [Candidatus Poribacteria bacterium]
MREVRLHHQGTTIVIGVILMLGILRQAEVYGMTQTTAIPKQTDIKTLFAETLELPSLIRVAVDRNPKVSAAKARWQATIEQYPQATALPDPMFMYGYYMRSVETRVGPQRHRVSFSQSFPYPGTLEAAGEVVKKAIEIERVKHEQVIRDLIVELKLSYHELAYLQRAVELTRQNHELVASILAIATTRYAEGQTTLNDVLKAQSQLAQLEYDLVLLEELRHVEQANIKGSLSIPSATALGVTVPIPYEPLDVGLADIEKQALAKRQELQIAALSIEKATEGIALAELQTKPMLKFDLMTIETGKALMFDTPGSGKNPFSIGVGVTIPWSSLKNSSKVREAQQNREAVTANKHSLEDETKVALRKIYFRLENARRLVELYETTLIPQAGAAVEAAETWHQEGPKSIASFLETQSVWLNFNLARLRAIADYQQNVARLERLVGGKIDDSHTEQ